MASKKKTTAKKRTSKRSPAPASTRAKRGQPKTMEELLAAAESPVISLKRGQKLKGKIVEITKKRVAVDIGGKSEGIVAERAFNEAKDFIKGLKVGDEIDAKVLVSETPEGYVILSLRDAAVDSSWKKLEQALKKDKVIEVVGLSAMQSGVTVDVWGLTGFVPHSQLGQHVKNPLDLVGQRIDVKVVELDKVANKVVLSERDVSEAEDIKLAQDALKKIKVGKVYDGEVTKLYDFGFFVRIRVALKRGEKVSVEGLVHISEISWSKVDEVAGIVKEGDKVKVKVLSVKDGKLSLSIKQAQEDPWEKAEKKYKKDAKVKGTVVRSLDYGVIVQLEPGIEGLIHMTKIPPGKKIKEGESIEVYIEEIDPKARKLSLGLILTEKPVGYK